MTHKKMRYGHVVVGNDVQSMINDKSIFPMQSEYSPCIVEGTDSMSIYSIFF